MAFQAGGAHALDRALEAIAYAWTEMTRTPHDRAVGEAGPRRAAADGEDLHGRAARARAGDRLQHLPDLELLAGPVRLAGLRQPGHRQAAPGRGAAAGDHRAGLPAGAGGGGLRPAPGHAGRGGPRRQAGRDARRATRGAGSSTSPAATPSATGSRSTRARPWCSPRRPASTPSSSTRRRRSRRCARTSRSPSRSTPARCARRRRTSTCPPTASRPTRATSRVGRGRRRASARRSRSCSATTPARSSCSAASSTPACSSASTRRRRTARCWCASRAVTHPAYADATVRTPTIIGLTAADSDVYENGVLRTGRLPHRDRRDRRVDRAVPRHRASRTAR